MKTKCIFIIEEILHATLINVNKLDHDCDKTTRIKYFNYSIFCHHIFTAEK